MKNLPNAEKYERSYMHKDVVEHILIAQKNQFVITISTDGFVKFWKKNQVGITFVKSFKAATGRICAAALSHDHCRLITASAQDQMLKIFDVVNFDLMHLHKTPFTPGPCVLFINQKGSFSYNYAVSHGSQITVFKEGQDSPLHVAKDIHYEDITHMAYSYVHNFVVSLDASGMIEIWDSQSFEFPQKALQFELISDTQFLEVAEEAPVVGVTFGRKDSVLVVWGGKSIWFFDVLSGKVVKKRDVSLELEGLGEKDIKVESEIGLKQKQ